MLDTAITNFFAERKEAWLKKNLKASMDDNQAEVVKQECDELFALKAWLPNAAKRAGQISIATHPCTFSHPSARKNKNGYVSSIIANKAREADGLLRSGNVDVEPDALGNAAALDVYKFLTLQMEDGQKLLNHLESNTELAQTLLTKGGDYQQLRDGFLQMVVNDNNMVTSSKIKQVYFPLNDGNYHLLSTLTNSGMVFELRKRIDKLRFLDDEGKLAKEKKRKGEYSEQGYSEIYGITTIGYGGTKPQNISVLNNQNAGKAHLLASIPPSLTSRDIRVPTQNFFTQTINPWQVKECFYAFHKLLKVDRNNLSIRDCRDSRIEEYVDIVQQKMWQLRHNLSEHSQPLASSLPASQITWLSPTHAETREQDDTWLIDICNQLARNFVKGYQTVLGKKAVVLGDAELQEIIDVVRNQKEGLR